MPSAINFCSAVHNGYASMPEGIIVSGANAVTPCVPPTPVSAFYQARVNGTTILTPFSYYDRRTLFGPHQAYFSIVGFLWTWTGDPIICANDQIEYRVHWTYSDASTEDTAWTAPVPFLPGASGIPGIGGAGHDPMLDEILASVRKTYSSF